MIAVALALLSLAIMGYFLLSGGRPMYHELTRFPGNDAARERWREQYRRVPLEIQVAPIKRDQTDTKLPA